MAHPPMEKLAKVLRQNGLIRFIEHYEALFPNNHLKDIIVDEIGPDRRIRVNGHEVVNFGPDRFLARVLGEAKPYRVAVVAIDGVYSMSGALPPLAELNVVAQRHDAVLYVDDAHATAVMGHRGRGTVFDALGNYDNTFVIGSLSKG